MKRTYTIAIAALATLLLATAAYAQVALGGIRIGAKDPSALAKFYQTVFGMQETNRMDTVYGLEVFVNFGATLDAAKAVKSFPIMIMFRDSDDVKDPIAHVILSVKDINAVAAAIKANGGKMVDGPRQFRNTTTMLGVGVDPAGNRIEMLQRP